MSDSTEHRLDSFTDKRDVVRWALGTPWFFDGLAFATDGRIAAWMPSEPFEFTCDGRRPNAAEIIRRMPAGLVFQPLVELPPLSACRDCNGLGYTIEEECSDCNGTGSVEHECDCPHCCEDEEDCESCDGTGKFTGEDAKVKCNCLYQPIEVQGDTFALEYLHKIAALGSPVVAVKDEQLWFKCDDITGTIMKLQPSTMRRS